MPQTIDPFSRWDGCFCKQQKRRERKKRFFIHHGIALELGALFAYDIGYMICRIGMQYELTMLFGVDRGSGEKGKGCISSFAPQLSFTLPLWTR
ncbi:hypothetical protein HQ36_01775 [Porphyromonas gingivicanis]|uniref:Uncharacterized protein n=1 Tax=Porphyromonas gingivicanis TaxID=266762 RepID=A0A0A2GFE8_9PORP|nr:hypothetical protein [Porphyromonas gingivicanis]KGN99204.1 hypothetical protein HQ36_01775 [Porphyromonas gingivicanis]